MDGGRISQTDSIFLLYKNIEKSPSRETINFNEILFLFRYLKVMELNEKKFSSLAEK